MISSTALVAAMLPKVFTLPNGSIRVSVALRATRSKHSEKRNNDCDFAYAPSTHKNSHEQNREEGAFSEPDPELHTQEVALKHVVV